MERICELPVVPQTVLPRSSSRSSSSTSYKSNNTASNNKIIIPYTTPPTTSTSHHHRDLIRRPATHIHRAAAYLRSLFSIFSASSSPSLMPTCTPWLAPSTYSSPLSTSPRKVAGTLFGHRRGQVTFAVQIDPRSKPFFLIELAVSTSTLVKEMSSGLVRIALESDKSNTRRVGDYGGAWAMYCNGRKCGYANSRECTEADLLVLSTVKTVSVGAGVIPPMMVDDGGGGVASPELGELLYMRARFERVVGSRDSEAYYMLNPDGNGGPELSFFLLRV